jgi:hypothetical protein
LFCYSSASNNLTKYYIQNKNHEQFRQSKDSIFLLKLIQIIMLATITKTMMALIGKLLLLHLKAKITLKTISSQMPNHNKETPPS